MKFANNFKWELDKIEDELFEKIKILQEKGEIVYGLLMHPETYHSIITSDDYWKMHSVMEPTNSLFYYKVVMDPQMHLGEWEILVRKN